MTSVKQALGVAVATGAVAVLSALPASAGAVTVVGSMEATPNPAMVGDTVTIANVPGDNNTCVYMNYESEAGPALEPIENTAVVVLEIMAPDAFNLPKIEVTPDQDGNWSYEFMVDQVGTYLVDASCDVGVVAEPVVSAMAPFQYSSLDLVVNQVPDTLETTTSMETADTSGQTTTTAAAAVAAAPRYTG